MYRTAPSTASKLYRYSLPGNLAQDSAMTEAEGAICESEYLTLSAKIFDRSNVLETWLVVCAWAFGGGCRSNASDWMDAFKVWGWFGLE